MAWDRNRDVPAPLSRLVDLPLPLGRFIVRIQAWICGESAVEVECRDEQAQQMRRTTEVRR